MAYVGSDQLACSEDPAGSADFGMRLEKLDGIQHPARDERSVLFRILGERFESASNRLFVSESILIESVSVTTYSLVYILTHHPRHTQPWEASPLERQRGERNAMIQDMEPLHISEGDLVKDLRSILQRVETGAEVIIERDAHPVAVIRPADPVRRKISECIALMPADSTATIDPDFAKDIEAAIAAHREPLEPPAWD